MDLPSPPNLDFTPFDPNGRGRACRLAVGFVALLLAFLLIGVWT